MKRPSTFILLLFFLCIGEHELLALQNDSIPTINQSLPIEEFMLLRDIGDLPDVDLKNILKDDLGFLWMNTRHHLVRYDGNTFLVLESQPRSQYRLHGDDLTALGKDPDGNIIVQYEDNDILFDIINPVSLEITPIYFESTLIIDTWVSDNTFPVFITCVADTFRIFEVQNGQIIEHGRLSHPRIKNPSDVKIGYKIQDQLWIYEHGEIILTVNPNNTFVYEWPATQNDGGISFFHLTKGKRLYLAFNDFPGLFSLSDQSDSILLSDDFPQDEIYGNIWEDRVGNLMLSVKLNFRNIKEYLLKTPQNILYHDKTLVQEEIFINDLYAENILEKPYFATYRGLFVGISNNAQFKNFLKKDISTNQWGTVCRGVTAIDNHQLVVSHEFDSISIIDIQTNQVLSKNVLLTNPEDSIPFQMSCASNLKYDGQNTIWGSSCDASKNAYLYAYNITNDSVSTFLCFKNSLITDFTFDSTHQKIWTSIRYQGKDGILGAFSLVDSTFAIEKGPIDPIFRGNIPNSIYQDPIGALLLATDKGLVRYDIEQQNLSLAYEQLKEQKLYCVIRSKDQSLIAGGYNGLFIIDSSGNINSYSRERGIKTRVASLVEDRFGNLWIGTFNGLLYFDRSLEIITRYTDVDGLPNNEFNTRSFHEGPNNYFMGTINGLVSIKKIDELDEQNELQPSILQIRKLHNTRGSLIQNTNLNKLKKLIINPSDLTVNISIFNPYFLGQKKETFAYKVEGSDITWKSIALNEDIQLEKLKPGEYNLRVRMKKDNGLWSRSELSLPIVVRSEFYKSTWFILLSTLIGMAILGLIMHYYNVKARKKQQEENDIQQKFAELELHALRSQMNPHFIFNSLNAIQYFIQSNDRKQSDEYISKFAHLIRLFLEASKKKYISLDEEIKVIRAYIELEKLRFRGKMESNIEIEESLNSMDTIIPSMLIQPFVENAINHGIFHKSSAGLVNIKIKEVNDDLLECTIEDDGIGRKKAREIKQKSIGKYESQGISLIDDRIHVLQRSLSQNIDYQIIDLEENGRATGTKVVLKLPIIE